MSSTVLIVVVVLNMIATITLWRTAARRPDKLKKKFLAALMDNKPIVPRHQRPESIGEGWGVHDRDRKFFTDFEDFADVVNWWFANPHAEEPWRLQELADTDLQLEFHDSPTYGRRYDIYHNQVRVGALELQAYLDGNVLANIKIEWARLAGARQQSPASTSSATAIASSCRLVCRYNRRTTSRCSSPRTCTPASKRAASRSVCARTSLRTARSGTCRRGGMSTAGSFNNDVSGPSSAISQGRKRLSPMADPQRRHQKIPNTLVEPHQTRRIRTPQR